MKALQCRAAGAPPEAVTVPDPEPDPEPGPEPGPEPDPEPGPEPDPGEVRVDG
ncbi:hypothetical protein ACIQ62_35330 [Streptomyces sp. NPDC096319]|uniref:hypothetical protein n=1 Tax=Streptomyces sp. NPDC096319 TaxID=3366084 RepID=UPI00380C0F53